MKHLAVEGLRSRVALYGCFLAEMYQSFQNQAILSARKSSL
jgi:hypothetical protein